MEQEKREADEKVFWADKIAKALDPHAKHVVSDAKTPSGRIHVGSLRGVMIHDVVYKALEDNGLKTEFVYRFDDFDPMDGFPAGLDESFRKYMGMPLCNVPSPEPGYESFARFYAEEFRGVFDKLGCKPRILWSSANYKSGAMNGAIKTALENASKIKEVNERVSGTKKAGDWLPINPVCEKCGQIGGVVASDYDGKTVAYECKDTKYSKGCGNKGRVSPFDGNAKLTWKVDWAAIWKVLGVTVEGAGKDHYAAGGSHEVAMELSSSTFNYKPPYDVPYEHFLIGGKKMSSSKGLGVSAKDVAELLPPEILRFVMVRYKPRTAIEFDPQGDSVPRLFDDYDSFAESTFGKREPRDPDEPRIYKLSQPTEAERHHPTNYYHASFPLVAYLIQVPHLDVVKIIEKRKGAPLTPYEQAQLDARMASARVWLDKYAGEEDKMSLLQHAEAVKRFTELPPKVQETLHDFARFYSGVESEDAQFEKIKETTAKHGVTTKEFFEAAYGILIGKTRGPKLLPFINALDRQFVVGRFKGVH